MTLRETLDALPKTSEGIAAYFTQYGIKGKKKKHCYCPVANYLKSQGYFYASAMQTNIMARSQNELGVETFALVICTEAMRTFIIDFDDGVYPQLEED